MLGVVDGYSRAIVPWTQQISLHAKEVGSHV